jgi:hypothetical protein
MPMKYVPAPSTAVVENRTVVVPALWLTVVSRVLQFASYAKLPGAGRKKLLPVLTLCVIV